MVNSLSLKPDSGVFGELLTVLSVLQLVLGVLSLLDLFSVPYLSHTVGEPSTVAYFDLGVTLIMPLSILLIVFILYMIRERWFTEVIVFSCLGLLSGFLWSWGVSVSLLSIILPVLTVIRKRDYEDYLFWALILATGFTMLNLIHWMFLPLGVVSPFERIAGLGLDLYYVAAPIAPPLALFALFSWGLAPLSKRYMHLSFLSEEKPRLDFWPRKYSTGLVVFSLVLGVVMVLIPYAPGVNPDGRPIGVDFSTYVDSLESVSEDWRLSFSLLDGSRPLTLLLLNIVKTVFGLSTVGAVKYLPVFIVPCLIFSVSFFVFQSMGDHHVAAVSAFVTAVSPYVTVGLYAYFLSNMLALSFVFISLGFLYMSFESGDKVHLVFSLIFNLFVLFSHPYTFMQYYFAFLLSTVMLFFRPDREFLDWRSHYIVYAFISGVFFIGRLWLLNNIGVLPGGLLPGFIIKPSLQIWDNIIFGFLSLYGAAFSNVLFWIVAAFGFYKYWVEEGSRLLIAALFGSTSCVYLLSGGMMMSRLVYNLPWPVFVGAGLIFLINSDKLKLRTRICILLFSFSYFLIYGIRASVILV